MRLFGITGGIGMGKSTSAQLLEDWGVPVIDTDALAHQLVEPGQPALEEIRLAFGDEVIDEHGRLRRSVLADLVFDDQSRRVQLEGILHPRIRDAWLSQVARWRASGQPCGAVVVPLLYETGAAPLFDAILCVGCKAETQRERLLARGWSDEHLARRIAAQWPIEKKLDLANYVIWTEPPLDVHAAQLRRILGP